MPAARSKPAAAADPRGRGAPPGTARSSEPAGGAAQRPRAPTPAAAAAAAAQRKVATDLASPEADPFEFPADHHDAQASVMPTSDYCRNPALLICCIVSAPILKLISFCVHHCRAYAALCWAMHPCCIPCRVALIQSISCLPSSRFTGVLCSAPRWLPCCRPPAVCLVPHPRQPRFSAANPTPPSAQRRHPARLLRRRLVRAAILAGQAPAQGPAG